MHPRILSFPEFAHPPKETRVLNRSHENGFPVTVLGGDRVTVRRVVKLVCAAQSGNRVTLGHAAWSPEHNHIWSSKPDQILHDFALPYVVRSPVHETRPHVARPPEHNHIPACTMPVESRKKEKPKWKPRERKRGASREWYGFYYIICPANTTTKHHKGNTKAPPLRSNRVRG